MTTTYCRQCWAYLSRGHGEACPACWHCQTCGGPLIPDEVENGCQACAEPPLPENEEQPS